MCKHRSLPTPPLPATCAACHCQGPMIQGQLPQENTWHDSGCCNLMPASAAADSPCIPYHSLLPSLSDTEPPNQWLLNLILSGQRTEARGEPTCRGGAKSKADPQELCEQRRERKISPSSLRSSGLNLHNQLDVPCICGIPEETVNHPQIEVVDFGSNCRLGVCCMRLTSF